MPRSSPRHALPATRPLRHRILAMSGALLIGAAVVTAPSASAQLPGAPQSSAPRLSTAQVATSRLAEVASWAQWGVDHRIPYRYGGGHGSTPSIAGGADCSGFVRWAYYQGFGVDIGRGSADSMIRTSGKFVQVSRPVPGDVVLLGRGGSAPAYHTSIYVGIRDGHPASAAESTTGQPAKIQHWYSGTAAQNFMGYWRYRGAGAADLPTSNTASRISASLTASAVSADQLSQIRATARTTGGTAIEGAVLNLYQRAPGGNYRLAARATTRSGAATFRIGGNGVGHQFLVRYAGDARHSGADAPVLTQYSRSTVRATSGARGPLRAGGVYRMNGSTSARLAGSKVQLQRITSRGWVAAGGATIVGKDGRFGLYWRPSLSTSYRLWTAGRSVALEAATASPTYPIVVR